MTIIHNFLLALDPYIIWTFRLTNQPWIGFFLGCMALNGACILLGDLTSILAKRLNRKFYGAYHEDMAHHHNLSIQALRNADKPSFKAVNKQANDAFGKYFFSQAGAFTLSIWPLPFALAWMDMRFGGLPLALPFAVPGVGENVFYPFFFLPIYIALRILYGRGMRRILWYQRLLHWTAHDQATQMLPFLDLFKSEVTPETSSPDDQKDTLPVHDQKP